MIKEDQTEFSTIKVPGGIIILNVTQQAALSHLTNREWMEPIVCLLLFTIIPIR